MFGRRRRPILGAAVVVGASRAAARHEVQQQAVMQSQREIDIQREVNMRMREDEEQERRTQRAVDEAVKAAVAGGQVSTPQQNTAAVTPQPSGQVFAAQAMLSPQPQGQVIADDRGQPGQTLEAYSAQAPPAYRQQQPYASLGERPKSAHGISSTQPVQGPKTVFCCQCGFACEYGDKFCRRCGTKQVVRE